MKPNPPTDTPAPEAAAEPIHEARTWRDNGWTAQVIKNEDDDGWAVSMTPDGQAEPALVGPWTMGRDKKNPKPLDTNAFNTLVKTAHEVVRRHEQHLQALLHKRVDIYVDGVSYAVKLDIVPDADDPYALLSAHDDGQRMLAQVKVAAGFKLNADSAQRWVEGGFERPR
ncbi:MAG: hypothetical protein ACKVQR_12505 [Aquabacterium sp.]